MALSFPRDLFMCSVLQLSQFMQEEQKEVFAILLTSLTIFYGLLGF